MRAYYQATYYREFTVEKNLVQSANGLMTCGLIIKRVNNDKLMYKKFGSER